MNASPTRTQVDALMLVVEAVTEAVKAAGPLGAPGGYLYAAMMTQGCTLRQFESIMDAMVSAGRLRKAGEIYHLAA